jgi:hypothetical protein
MRRWPSRGTAVPSSLPAHMEATLGRIEAGWTPAPDGDELRFQQVRYTSAPGSLLVAYSTLGLSRHSLRTPSGKVIRQELLMLAPADLDQNPVLSRLQQVGEEILHKHEPLRTGAVLGPRGQLFPGAGMTALYVTRPVYFPDDFATFPDVDGDIVISWLVPITTAEAAYVADHGWERFEQLLEQQDPDLTDVKRRSLR